MNASHEHGADLRRAELATWLEPIVAAATRGQYNLLLAETERLLTHIFPGANSRVVMHLGGVWRDWSALDGGQDCPEVVLPEGQLDWDRTQVIGNHVFVPIAPGAACLVTDIKAGGIGSIADLDILRQCILLALQTCERQRIAANNLDEVQALQRVATRMLKSHDLGEILLLITQEAKRLLSADICGVLLREDNQIVMRRCVGNHSPDTASLRMHPGQGLAGRVLERKEPSAVEDYLESEIISRDFFYLAEAEMVRSALAAPLLSHNDVIGVLEVWRRRPSTFSALDSTRLVALANLTSIAIDNATLYASQRTMVEELTCANDALNQRYDLVRNLSNLTQSLMLMLLQGASLSAIVTSASNFLESDVAILDLSGQVRAWGGASNAPDVQAAIAVALPRRNDQATPPEASHLDLGSVHGVWLARPLTVEGEAVGWVVGRVGPRGFDVTELGVVQVAMVASIHHLERRAASRARSETVDAIVWDLFQTDETLHVAATDRASEIKIDLEGPLRLFVGELGPSPPGHSDRAASVVRQEIVSLIANTKAAGVRAIAMRGLSLAILCSDEPLDDAERWAQKLAQRIEQVFAGRQVFVGSSSRCLLVRRLPVAYREALIALDVARQLGRTGSVVYDRAGVVGMLVGLRHETGMQRFLELNFGALLQENKKQRDLLLQTLRVFFDANCSYEAAAQRLNVHRKTISYRLTKISELTGLDLSTHDDRLVADLGLYVYRMITGSGE